MALNIAQTLTVERASVSDAIEAEGWTVSCKVTQLGTFHLYEKIKENNYQVKIS